MCGWLDNWWYDWGVGFVLLNFEGFFASLFYLFKDFTPFFIPLFDGGGDWVFFNISWLYYDQQIESAMGYLKSWLCFMP
jgi:hypothetical protein